MPRVDCELRAFSLRPNIAGIQHLEVNRQMLIECAAKVGIPVLASNLANSRSFIEMLWRAGIVISNLESTKPPERWTRSESYNRLDPSEKSAVSYFLGMVQAALTTKYVLGYPHLVHVDELLQDQGHILGGRRPDFVAVNPTKSYKTSYSAVVEAKGRTNGVIPSVLRKAKDQASRIPAIKDLTPKEAIASVAYFNEDNYWACILQDPDWAGGYIDVDLERYLFIYYRNIISAGRESGTWELVNERVSVNRGNMDSVHRETGRETRENPQGGKYQFALAGIPIMFQIPKVLVDAYDESAEVSSQENRGDFTPLLDSYYRIFRSNPELPGDLVVSNVIEGNGLDDIFNKRVYISLDQSAFESNTQRNL